MHFSAVFDNSPDNPVNPDPNATVFWGDQTWEEMAMTVVTVAVPLRESRPPGRNKTVQRWSPDDLEAASDYATRYIGRLDTNADGVITKGELPKSVPSGVFWRMSGNDGTLTAEDVAREYLQRLSGR